MYFNVSQWIYISLGRSFFEQILLLCGINGVWTMIRHLQNADFCMCYPSYGTLSNIIYKATCYHIYHVTVHYIKSGDRLLISYTANEVLCACL